MPNDNFLRDLVIPRLDALGATARDRAWEPGLQRTLETAIGKLDIHVIDGDWIACRFDDVEKAKEHFGVRGLGCGRLNPYSGKWNWHHFEYAPVDSQGRIRPRKVLEAALETLAKEFLEEIETILPVKQAS
jgi:hypothetical protein